MFYSRDATAMNVDSKNLRNSSPAKSAGSELKISKQKRALLTRKQLVRSARAIFARDGFQHARIEDIAARAGKTRGAFYANFKDKEDVFFEIFEEELDRDMAALRPILQGFSTLDERLHVLAEYLCKLGKDRQRTLLNLEFKMYAIRHPHRRKRLADLHAVMRLRCSLPEIDELLPEYYGQDATQKRTESLAVGAVMDGLALNQLFDPRSLTDEDATRYLTVCLHQKLRAMMYGDLIAESGVFLSGEIASQAPQSVL
jgi:AcrR family transcriptional regulator